MQTKTISSLILLLSLCACAEGNHSSSTIKSTVDPNDPASMDTSMSLAWSDEFNGPSIDTTKWNFVINGGGGGSGFIKRNNYIPNFLFGLGPMKNTN